MRAYPQVHRFIRKTKSGQAFYYVRFNLNGKDVRRSLGPNKQVADLLAKEVETDLLHNRLKLPSRKKTTIQDWLNAFLTFSKKEKASSTYRSDWMRLKSFLSFLAEKNIRFLQEINFSVLDEYKNEISKRLSPKSVNNVVCVTKSMMKYAINMGMLDEDPSRKIKLFRNIPRRYPRVLSTDEVETLLAKADPIMQKAILFILLTGMRSSEFINCQWKDIDIENKLIKVQCREGFHTKSYKPRTIYFVKGLTELLNDIPKAGIYLFDAGENKPLFTVKALYAKLKVICRRSKIGDANIHSLRHSYATYLLQTGIDPIFVKEAMGHKDLKTTMIYCHLLPKEIKKRIGDVDFPCAKFVPTKNVPT
jgi:site-specific recombinase XerD